MNEAKTGLAKRGNELPPKDGGVREFLAFELSAECYALPLACVREIMRVSAVTEVPRAPSDVLGVISVRGQVTTVLDLRRKLHVAEAPISGRSRILLVDAGREIIGLLVDSVLHVYRLHDGEIELANVLGAEAPPYLQGLGRPAAAAQKPNEASRGAAPSELLLLLDPATLLRN
jgi:purine-binding chemotaxis protein CheW